MLESNKLQDETEVESVTSAELVRSFAKWREAAFSRPVPITTHGRVSHVLTGAELFEQMTRSRPAGGNGAMTTDQQLISLSERLKEGLLLCDSDEVILYANRQAKEFLDLEPLRPGTRLAQCLPELEGSVMQAQYRRTMEAKEALSADVPSLRRKGRWVNFQSIPLGEQFVLLVRDITEEVERYRMADAKEAMLEAISRNPDVSYVRLSPRGLIAMADSTLEDWIGIANEKLMGIRLDDLIVREHQHAFRKILDKVLERDCASNCDLDLLANRDEPLSAHCAIVPLRGAYGIEGASIIMTRR